jgi:hypothetical protein
MLLALGVPQLPGFHTLYSCSRVPAMAGFRNLMTFLACYKIHSKDKIITINSLKRLNQSLTITPQALYFCRLLARCYPFA